MVWKLFIIFITVIIFIPSLKIRPVLAKSNLAPPKNLFSQRIDRVLPEPQASLLNGMLFGIKTAMPKDFFNALKRTGVLHIIALSGTNISILVATVYTTLLVVCHRKMAILLSILMIIVFINFVGPSPSVLRAGIMASISLIVQYFGRQYFGLLSLVVTGILMCSVKPNLVFDTGFQLSFMATLGIMVLNKRKKICHSESRLSRDEESINKELNKTRSFASFARNIVNVLKMTLANTISDNLRITLSAQAFTLPIILANFGQLSLISPLTNILIAPVVPYITNWGMASALLLVSVKPLGILLSWVLWVLLSYFVLVIKLTGQIPLASINLPKIGWGVGVIYYLIVFYLFLRKRIRIIL